MEDKSVKTSCSYRLLKKLGFNYPVQEYGQVSLWDIIKRVLKTYRDTFLLKFVMESWLLSPLLPRRIRPWILRRIGCKVGKDVYIGPNVFIDAGHADMITIEDHAHLTCNTILLCHKRDLSEYYVGCDYADFPYRKGEIRLCKGCSTGTGSIIMPGVTIGEGSIVGAGSLVTKDIPAWTIATGRPAKVVKYIGGIKDENKESK